MGGSAGHAGGPPGRVEMASFWRTIGVAEELLSGTAILGVGFLLPGRNETLTIER